MSACPFPSRSGLQSGLPTIVGIPAESQPGALRRLDSDVLLRQFASVQARSRVNTAEVIVHIIEVHRRKLWRAAGRSSMYKYCIQVMHMSEAEAFRRVKAARVGQRFPVVLEAIADGRLHLTAVVLLAPHLGRDNVDELVSAASHQSRKQIEQMLAERFPKPDAPTVMRTLVHAVAANSPATSSDDVTKLALALVDTTDSGISAESMGPLAADSIASSTVQADVVATAATQIATQIVARLGGEQSGAGVVPAVAPQAILQAVTQVLERALANDPSSAQAIELHAKFTPLSPGRHCWQLTVDQESQDLMDEALDYVDLGSQAPQEVLKQALRCFVEQCRKRKFAQVARPRSQRGQANSPAAAGDTRTDARSGMPRSRHIPADVRRAVYARDGGRCTFESADGTRCDERRDLQFDHQIPFACGGRSTVENVRTLCGPHNRHEAERAFGERHVQELIRAGQRERRQAKVQKLEGEPRSPVVDE